MTIWIFCVYQFFEVRNCHVLCYIAIENVFQMKCDCFVWQTSIYILLRVNVYTGFVTETTSFSYNIVN